MARRAWEPKQVAMMAAALVLGMLVSFQWSAGASRQPVSPDRVSQTMHQLELEQAELKRRVGRLRDDVNALQQQAASNTEMLKDVRAELVAQKVRAGLVDVRGSGIQVMLDDGQRGAGGDANDLLIHDFDLRDVINVLWLAGAEAIAINDERIVHNTSIYCVGSTVMVNDTRLSPPYEIHAIGDPLRMQDYLRNPGYLTELKARHERSEIALAFMRVDSVTVPAYRGSVLQRFAQPGS